MTQTLRSLECKLVQERTDIAVYDCVAEVVCRWQDALEQGAPLLHPIASAGALARAALCRPFYTRVLSYIHRRVPPQVHPHRPGPPPQNTPAMILLFPLPSTPHPSPRFSLTPTQPNPKMKMTLN